jgi:hypothetical protein
MAVVASGPRVADSDRQRRPGGQRERLGRRRRRHRRRLRWWSWCARRRKCECRSSEALDRLQAGREDGRVAGAERSIPGSRGARRLARVVGRVQLQHGIIRESAVGERRRRRQRLAVCRAQHPSVARGGGVAGRPGGNELGHQLGDRDVQPSAHDERAARGDERDPARLVHGTVHRCLRARSARR